MEFLIILAVAAAGLTVVFFRSRKRTANPPPEFPPRWRTVLQTRVNFYQQLDAAARQRFEQDVQRFLRQVRITGVNTEVDITDRLLVASSAVIPVFGFPGWDYTFLDEVLLYPGAFDRDYAPASGEGEYITGMVGTGGAMEGKLILSKPSLHLGFDNSGDRRNVGIHEFIHLLDKEDGHIDGVPTILNKHAFSLPWLRLIRQKMKDIIAGDNEIDAYGATSETEFLAVAGEYFFEKPHLLQKNHPELYSLLARAFNHDAASTLLRVAPAKAKTGRNAPCPCGSGKKYKACCL